MNVPKGTGRFFASLARFGTGEQPGSARRRLDTGTGSGRRRRIDVAMTSLPVAPPFRLRARVLTPLAAGGTRYLADGAVDVDALGRISRVDNWAAAGRPESDASARIPDHDVRPWLVMPGLVDLHTHIPQLPNAGLGAGLDLLTWLERYTFPLERQFDVPAAERLGPLAMRTFAAAGTTTVVAYASADPDATEALFRSAEIHGIRAVIGLVLMDRAVGVEHGGEQSPDGDAGLRASASRRGHTAQRAPVRRSSCRRRRPWQVRCTPSTGCAGPHCRCGIRQRHGPHCRGWPARRGPAIPAPPGTARRTSWNRESTSDVGRHAGPCVRAPPPVLGAGPGDAGTAEGPHRLPGDPRAGLVA